jgi:predicted permease
VLVGQLAAADQSVFLDLSLDVRVLAFTAALGLLTATLFGTSPAWHMTRVGPHEALTWHGRTTTAFRISTVSVLVVVQVALSLILVVAAGLFLRSFASLTGRPVGFDRDRILLAKIESPTRAADPDARLALYERIRLAAAGVPGVESATISAMTPVNGQLWMFFLEMPDAPPLPEADRVVSANLVGADYFETFGTRLLAGRGFTSRDSRTSPGVAIVNRAFVAKYLGGQPPVGVRIRQGGYPGRPATDREIVGWVDDAVYRTMRDAGVPTVYLPIAQRPQPPPVITLSVRTAARAGATARLGERIAEAVSGVDADALLTVGLLDDQLRNSIVQERLVATLSGFFGGLALLLAGLGLYGVTSYGVTRRRMEIGIRMALGARPGGVVGLVLGRIARLVVLGGALGAGVTLWASKFVAALLYGLEPRDPLTLVGALLLLIATGTVAGWLPARRASRIDPARVLRES